MVYKLRHPEVTGTKGKRMKIIQLRVFVRHHMTKAEKKRGERKGKLERIDIVPPSQDIQDMKRSIAQTIRKIESKIEYYYVVVVVRRPDRTYGYRNVIPKTLVA